MKKSVQKGGFFAFVFIVVFMCVFCASCVTTNGETSLDGSAVPSAVAGTQNEDALQKSVDLTPVVPHSTNFMVRTAAKLIPSTIIKNEKKLATAKGTERINLLAETGKNYVMYANAFIQHNAQLLPLERYDEQNAELVRAKAFYLKGRDYVLESLDSVYGGMKEAFLSGDAAHIDEAASLLTADSVEQAYWCGAAWLAAFSLEPLDTALLQTVSAATTLLERAAFLDDDYDNGAIWDVLCAFYAAAPIELGGSDENALVAHQKALNASGGKTIGPYITYAQSLCLPAMDKDAYLESLEKALATKKPSGVTAGVAYTISREKAQWLIEHVDDYFIDWDEE